MSVQKQSKERHYGKGSRGCTRCGTKQGVVRRYGINLCRQCFREVAVKMGFKKFR